MILLQRESFLCYAQLAEITIEPEHPDVLKKRSNSMSMGFLRSCMDRRFVAATRKAFEEKSGLGPTDYWHEAYAGGSAIAWHEAYASAPIQANEDLGVKYVLEHAEK